MLLLICIKRRSSDIVTQLTSEPELTELTHSTLSESVDSFQSFESEGLFQLNWLVHSSDSVDVVIGDKEAKVESEVDHGPEHGLADNEYKAPDIIGDVVDVFQGARY